MSIRKKYLYSILILSRLYTSVFATPTSDNNPLNLSSHLTNVLGQYDTVKEILSVYKKKLEIYKGDSRRITLIEINKDLKQSYSRSSTQIISGILESLNLQKLIRKKDRAAHIKNQKIIDFCKNLKSEERHYKIVLKKLLNMDKKMCVNHGYIKGVLKGLAFKESPDYADFFNTVLDVPMLYNHELGSLTALPIEKTILEEALLSKILNTVNTEADNTLMQIQEIIKFCKRPNSESQLGPLSIFKHLELLGIKKVLHKDIICGIIDVLRLRVINEEKISIIESYCEKREKVTLGEIRGHIIEKSMSTTEKYIKGVLNILNFKKKFCKKNLNYIEFAGRNSDMLELFDYVPSLAPTSLPNEKITLEEKLESESLEDSESSEEAEKLLSEITSTVITCDHVPNPAFASHSDEKMILKKDLISDIENTLTTLFDNIPSLDPLFPEISFSIDYKAFREQKKFQGTETLDVQVSHGLNNAEIERQSAKRHRDDHNDGRPSKRFKH